jgi:hypothetical protein
MPSMPTPSRGRCEFQNLTLLRDLSALQQDATGARFTYPAEMKTAAADFSRNGGNRSFQGQLI